MFSQKCQLDGCAHQTNGVWHCNFDHVRYDFCSVTHRTAFIQARVSKEIAERKRQEEIDNQLPFKKGKKDEHSP